MVFLVPSRGERIHHEVSVYSGYRTYRRAVTRTGDGETCRTMHTQSSHGTTRRRNYPPPPVIPSALTTYLLTIHISFNNPSWPFTRNTSSSAKSTRANKRRVQLSSRSKPRKILRAFHTWAVWVIQANNHHWPCMPAI